MQHIIIGCGPAGVIAAERLRALDSAATITLIGDEPEPPYSRMALPYLLVGKIAEQGTWLRKAPDHFEQRKITLRQAKVERVEAGSHQITLNDGERLSYDKLLIATGSCPVTPPIPGIELAGISSCWTMADARTIAQRVKPGSRVVLMGAGFIGCIILEALVRSGAKLTVVEQDDRMVPRMMNEKAGNLIKQWCIGQGIDVQTGCRVSAIEPGSGEHPLVVQLESGRSIEADLVVTATGVKANIGFLQGSGIATDQGILIDRTMGSSISDVYAAGDVAQGLDFSTNDFSVQAIQPTAADHGQIAASNMAGERRLHQGSINMNVLDTVGLIASSFGLWMGVEGGDSSELYHPERFRYSNLQFQDDLLVGATAIGMTQHVGVLRGLIQSRIRLGDWKTRLMRDPTRVMEAWLASIQAGVVG